MSEKAVAKLDKALSMNGRGLQINSLQDALAFGEMVVKSGIAPASLKSAADVVVAMQTGMEIGLSPMVAVQNMAVVNGKATLMGDAAKGLVQASPVCEYIKHHYEGQGESLVCIVESKRKDAPEPHVTRFGMAHAKAAQLVGKAGPWKQYTARMLYYRALGFNLRDNFADVLKGVHLREEFAGHEFRETDIAVLDPQAEMERRVRDILTAEKEGFDGTDAASIIATIEALAKAKGAPLASADDWTKLHAETTDDEIVAAYDAATGAEEGAQDAPGGAGTATARHPEPAPDLSRYTDFINGINDVTPGAVREDVEAAVAACLAKGLDPAEQRENIVKKVRSIIAKRLARKGKKG